jgi:hypothetical protein
MATNKDLQFENINNDKNIGKVYLAVTNTTPPRRVFVRYDGDINFTYFLNVDPDSFNGINDEARITYPNDFHSENETISFYEMSIPDNIAKKIQLYGTQYGGKKQTRKTKKTRKTKSHKSHKNNNKNKKK